ncbi:hypothetical protein CH92_20800 [Stutzerimonas stutzeri]|uniref:Glycoside hydrolase n=1 Tax=Stutzerimonas stutzeri TaxID=316 RepID=W8RZ27_STUST|nr:hypothetical protein [Stutzerimonas stutzeri]AHL77386.1 hypothetical protein CH92_20800 [Stutzerimonas stutzeri]MCQ4330281.1 hypothetical protein [Stutzerimonas stutzeri]
MKRIIALLVGLLSNPIVAADLNWQALRDGTLYLYPQGTQQLQISWHPAWQAEANEEHLYLVDGRGQLLADRTILASETSGQQRWSLSEASAPYRLEIPGYSFRDYQVSHTDSVAAMLEPVKLHFSADVSRNVTLYFHTRAGERAVLAGKYHGGVQSLQARRLADGQQVSLMLKAYDTYSHFDQVALPVSKQDQVWQLKLVGSGKAAFWLDGTPNLFAQRPDHLRAPHWDPGEVRLRLDDVVLGPAPSVGIELPYAAPPESAFAALDLLKPQAGGYYSFVDVLSQQPDRERPFREIYQERFGIERSVTLLAGSGRRAVLMADATTLSGLAAWLDDSRALGGGLHYLAVADEPNLNYPDFDSFERYFAVLSRQIRASTGAYAAGVRIAMPASSRLVNGPTRDNAAQRRGAGWATRLLARHGSYIDALAWHEWMVRDLLATRVYRDSVLAAAKLVGLDEHARPRKALLLDQTNISSGSSLSPYEQNTHFASLWWASVVINASQDGLLDMINYFQAADEPDYPKGMLRADGQGGYALKPVGLAQAFIARHWGNRVVKMENDAFEVDALALDAPTEGAVRRRVLGVNKVPREQKVRIEAVSCANAFRLTLFGPDSTEREGRWRCDRDTLSFSLPGETLFSMDWERP